MTVEFDWDTTHPLWLLLSDSDLWSQVSSGLTALSRGFHNYGHVFSHDSVRDLRSEGAHLQ